MTPFVLVSLRMVADEKSPDEAAGFRPCRFLFGMVDFTAA
jgi:hypothetical protein